jgi:hypothetical protein
MLGQGVLIVVLGGPEPSAHGPLPTNWLVLAAAAEEIVRFALARAGFRVGGRPRSRRRLLEFFLFLVAIETFGAVLALVGARGSGPLVMLGLALMRLPSLALHAFASWLAYRVSASPRRTLLLGFAVALLAHWGLNLLVVPFLVPLMRSTFG